MLRLASFNVLHGRSLADGQVSTERLAEACASLEADVLALQEIDRDQARSGAVDQTAAVAAAMGAGHWRFEPALVGEPGATWRAADDADLSRQEPGYGVGLVSKLPVRAWHVVRLRAAKVRAPVAVPGGRGRFILLPDEPRVALAAEVETSAGPLVVATTHLSFVPGWNLAQLRKVTGALMRLDLPCV
ncbi:MAG TPA: endonuclease/exonuclease/phosphatase family protein, partial [Acidimicrobiales bacterium]|nr:endonuclease/exonuclease/phosphatase family protein [Acidimicrobiales bacterium]